MRNLSYQVPFTILKQSKKRYVAYAPSLDLSTSGKTKQQATKRFEEIAGIFFEELMEAGTLDRALVELGWQKYKKHWQAPEVVSQEYIDVRVPVAR